MKKGLTMLVTAYLLLADPLIALASDLGQESLDLGEPNNGMTHGRDPEWGRVHVSYHGNREDHREYHIRKLDEHLAWHKQWKASQGTKAFTEAHRVYHENLNAEHREAHRGETVAAAPRTLNIPPAAHGGLIRFGRARPSRRTLEEGQQGAWAEQSLNFTN